MLKLPKEILKRIKCHGENEAPLEACGYLAGEGAEVKEYIIMTNTDKSAEHFSFDPKEQFAAVKTARAKGQTLIAVCQTHPASPARMSPEDIRLANDPSVKYVILSLLDAGIACFTVDKDKKLITEKVEVV